MEGILRYIDCSNTFSCFYLLFFYRRTRTPENAQRDRERTVKRTSPFLENVDNRKGGRDGYVLWSLFLHVLSLALSSNVLVS